MKSRTQFVIKLERKTENVSDKVLTSRILALCVNIFRFQVFLVHKYIVHRPQNHQNPKKHYNKPVGPENTVVIPATYQFSRMYLCVRMYMRTHVCYNIPNEKCYTTEQPLIFVFQILNFDQPKIRRVNVTD